MGTGKLQTTAPTARGGLGQHDLALGQQPRQSDGGHLAVLVWHFRNLRDDKVREYLIPEPMQASTMPSARVKECLGTYWGWISSTVEMT